MTDVAFFEESSYFLLGWGENVEVLEKGTFPQPFAMNNNEK